MIRYNMEFSINEFNDIITSVYLYNYPDFVNIQKKVHFLIDVYISRNSKEENIIIIKTLSNDVIYRAGIFFFPGNDRNF